MTRFQLRVNGESHSIAAPEGMPLLWILRDRLGLRGTKYGCGVEVCGACPPRPSGGVILSSDRW
jgi:isoquinoline 1-oxidoreductase alpha subunit